MTSVRRLSRSLRKGIWNVETKYLRQESYPLTIAARKRLTGRVRWYDRNKCYGFLREEDGMDDIFFHRSAIQIPGKHYLRAGQRVVFEKCQTAKGDILALNVVPIAERVEDLLKQKLEQVSE